MLLLTVHQEDFGLGLGLGLVNIFLEALVELHTLLTKTYKHKLSTKQNLLNKNASRKIKSRLILLYFLC